MYLMKKGRLISLRTSEYSQKTNQSIHTHQHSVYFKLVENPKQILSFEYSLYLIRAFTSKEMRHYSVSKFESVILMLLFHRQKN